jgi:hypothetical protein
MLGTCLSKTRGLLSEMDVARDLYRPTPESPLGPHGQTLRHAPHTKNTATLSVYFGIRQ